VSAVLLASVEEREPEGRTMLCNQCVVGEVCRCRSAWLVSDAELSNPEFIRDVRAFAHALGVAPDAWRDYLSNLYRDYPGAILMRAGVEIFLDMSEFERPNIHSWFDHFCCAPCPDHVTPYLRQEAWERGRVLATILRARFPEKAAFWGLAGLADNDNRPRR
ncbi:MAG: hypothetical protein MRY74_03310, partial [Neomegalonema sp.]|nr:hypothetical protein [Neomegalonema sp.]